MACDHWRRAGVLADLDVTLVLPRSSPLDVPRADVRLEVILSSYGVEVVRSAHVVEVGDRRLTVRTPDGDRELDDLTYAHVVPHYRAPGWIAEADLGQATDLVDIDPETLQHRRHPSVWAIGDSADVATRPSGGALRKQVDVLAHNLTRAGGTPPRRYDGYTVMPITTSRHRLMLVEVDRRGKLTPTVPFPDLIRPRTLTWWVDRYALPQTYFRRILRGKV